MPVKAGFSLEDITVMRIAQLAKATRRDKSSIVDWAIEELAQKEEFAHIQALERKPATPDSIPGVKKGVEA